jgi:hypothetical protein
MYNIEIGEIGIDYRILGCRQRNRLATSTVICSDISGRSFILKFTIAFEETLDDKRNYWQDQSKNQRLGNEWLALECIAILNRKEQRREQGRLVIVKGWPNPWGWRVGYGG